MEVYLQAAALAINGAKWSFSTSDLSPPLAGRGGGTAVRLPRINCIFKKRNPGKWITILERKA
jgi:hypothetical protein